MPSTSNRLAAIGCTLLAGAASGAAAQGPTIHVNLEYRAPVTGKPKVNFSPKGTQITLTPAAATLRLPTGALRPARLGVIEVGPDRNSWVPVLVTARTGFPGDLTQLFIDRNRNHDFGDDGPPLVGTPAQNAKTRAWWTSINSVELQVRYPKSTEPYLVNFWLVREDSAAIPDVMRYSTGSWRYGRTVVDGVPALVAAMDGDNNAVFAPGDMWSVYPADSAKAEQSVLSYAEARTTDRLMFLPHGTTTLVVQLRSISADGRSIDFAVVDRPVTKAADRLADDPVRDERDRPRTTNPVTWNHGNAGFTAALAAARRTGRRILLDFEATWCGPCHTMDQWIWSDADVAGMINDGFAGVKIDVDLEKGLVKRFHTTGYPTMILLDSAGREIRRVTDYQSSKQMLAFLNGKL